MISGILFLSCLFVCLFICLSVDNFNIHYNFWSTGDRVYIYGMHLTKDALLNDTKKVNDLVTLTLTFVAAGGIVLHKHMYFCPVCLFVCCQL